MSDNTLTERLVAYVEEHIGEDLSLEQIAEALNYSKYYIARTFAKETGSTIYKYVQGRRLTLAAKKLVETKEPIIEIAYEAHYNSQQAFTQAFHRLYECTPQNYRKNGIYYPKQTKLMLRTGHYASGISLRHNAKTEGFRVLLHYYNSMCERRRAA